MSGSVGWDREMPTSLRSGSEERGKDREGVRKEKREEDHGISEGDCV